MTAASSRSVPSGLSSDAADALCAHCGEPVPPGFLEPMAPEQFCCGGCRTVYGILRGHGLENYYRVRDALGEKGLPVTASASPEGYDTFDTPKFLAEHASPVANGQMCATLQLRGVHCAACVWLVERVGRITPGVVSCRLDVRRALATVYWDPAVTTLSSVARGLDQLGYASQPPRLGAAEERRRAEDREHLIRVGVAGAIAGNVMLLALPQYAGVFSGMSEAFATLFRWCSAVLGVIVLAWPGRVFFRGAIAALRTQAPHLDLPIALALFVGGAWGVVNTIRGVGEIYFDSLTVLVFLLLVGRWIQHAQQRRAADAIELLFSTTPRTARRVTGAGSVEVIDANDLAPGDVIEARSGETLAVDGRLVSDHAVVDEAFLSGEAAPRHAARDDPMVAGAVNVGDPIRVLAERTGGDTRVAKLMRLVADASSQRSAIVRRADRIAGYFVVAVSALAVITLGAWLFLDPANAVDHAAALLIVSCPCALGLATPLVITATIGRLARRGVLVRGGDALEKLGTPGTLLLDKTGTLTVAGLGLVDRVGDDAAAPLTVAVERGASHRVASALVEALGDEDLGLRARDVRQIAGRGAVGVVNDETVRVGVVELMTEAGVDVPPSFGSWVARTAAAGAHPVLVSRGSRVIAGFALRGDEPRPEAAALVSELKDAGWRLAIISGDRPEHVDRIAGAVGVDPRFCEAGVSPERKLERVREEIAAGHGPVVMMGDGVNDAAALAAADVGVAAHGGAEASLEAADVSIARPSVAPVLELVREGLWVRGRIRLCLIASLSYNASAATLAMAGLVHPLLAAVLMPISSITVVALAASGGASPVKMSPRESVRASLREAGREAGR